MVYFNTHEAIQRQNKYQKSKKGFIANLFKKCLRLVREEAFSIGAFFVSETTQLSAYTSISPTPS